MALLRVQSFRMLCPGHAHPKLSISLPPTPSASLPPTLSATISVSLSLSPLPSLLFQILRPKFLGEGGHQSFLALQHLFHPMHEVIHHWERLELMIGPVFCNILQNQSGKIHESLRTAQDQRKSR